MKFVLTKTSQGVFDTAQERARIRVAFKDSPAVKLKLLKLLDAIEDQDWKGAYKQLSSKWWNGRDAKCGCPRGEFVGLLSLARRGNPRCAAHGFSNTTSYADLVIAMNGCVSLAYETVYNVRRLRRGEK